jgi:hypothetical protein
MFKVEKKNVDSKIENNLKFVHMVLYQSALWRGYDCLMFHICSENWSITTMNQRDEIFEPVLLHWYDGELPVAPRI